MYQILSPLNGVAKIILPALKAGDDITIRIGGSQRQLLYELKQSLFQELIACSFEMSPKAEDIFELLLMQQTARAWDEA